MADRPNVIFIYADDLGRGMLSCYGQKYFQTPNIDRLAGEGIRFTRAYGASFCAPARASLLTGLHDCHRLGFTFTSGRIWEKLTSGEMNIDEISEVINTTGLQTCEGEVFLGQVARQAGYVTAEIGKLEWGFATTDKRIRSHGWDYHYGYYDHAQCHGFYPPYLFEDGKKVDIPGNTRDDFGKTPSDETDENRAQRWDMTGKAVYSQDLFDQKILQFLRDNRDKPFFLYHPSQLPHGPISIPEIHPAVADVDELTQFEKEYASMVLRLDQTVGLILNELETLGIDDKTAIVFCSDNGHQPYYVQEGRCKPNVNLATGEVYNDVTTHYTSEASGDIFNGNDSMAGKKFSNWEGGIRVPYLVRWPGKVSPGRVSDHMLANYDFMATLAEMISGQCPEGKDALSFCPELLGRDQQPHEYVIFASRLGPALITPQGWKIRHCRTRDDNIHQLYNLPEDYAEQNDLAWECPDQTRRLSKALLHECEGSLLCGTSEFRHVYLPGLQFFGPECHWDIL